jgi:hypothetical protein
VRVCGVYECERIMSVGDKNCDKILIVRSVTRTFYCRALITN